MQHISEVWGGHGIVLLCMSPTSNPIFEMKAVCSFKVHSLPLVVTLHDESPVGIRDLWTCSGGWTFRPLFGESGRSRPGGKVSGKQSNELFGVSFFLSLALDDLKEGEEEEEGPQMSTSVLPRSTS